MLPYSARGGFRPGRLPPADTMHRVLAAATAAAPTVFRPDSDDSESEAISEHGTSRATFASCDRQGCAAGAPACPASVQHTGSDSGTSSGEGDHGHEATKGWAAGERDIQSDDVGALRFLLDEDPLRVAEGLVCTDPGLIWVYPGAAADAPGRRPPTPATTTSLYLRHLRAQCERLGRWLAATAAVPPPSTTEIDGRVGDPGGGGGNGGDAGGNETAGEGILMPPSTDEQGHAGGAGGASPPPPPSSLCQLPTSALWGLFDDDDPEEAGAPTPAPAEALPAMPPGTEPPPPAGATARAPPVSIAAAPSAKSATGAVRATVTPLSGVRSAVSARSPVAGVASPWEPGPTRDDEAVSSAAEEARARRVRTWTRLGSAAHVVVYVVDPLPPERSGGGGGYGLLLSRPSRRHDGTGGKRCRWRCSGQERTRGRAVRSHHFHSVPLLP